ncbi:MAG: alkaline phosphatase family protein, partial [Armatimonadota bacterium]
MSSDKPRFMLIGMDGADWDIIEPFIEQGKLPVLQELMERGSHSVLRSTIPPLTPCAWTTMYTGVNPGKHGVFDFADYLCGQDRIKLTNGGSRRCKTLMQLCSEAGMSVGVLNAPWTYPPDELNGYVVSGMDTPEFGPDMANPRSVFDEITDLVGEYRIEPTRELWLRDEPYAEEVDEEIEKLTTVATWLMKNRPTDVFMMVFLITDLVQHGFIGDRSIESTSGKHYDDLILHTYQLVDAAIGEMIEVAGDDVPVFIMSDHGGAPFERFVILDALFRELGLLKLKEQHVSLRERVRKSLWTLGYRIKAVLPDAWLNRFRKSGARVREAITKDLAAPEMDWSSTVAVPMPSFGMIRVNLRGRDPVGIVEPGEEFEKTCDRISEILLDYRDPLDGQHIFAEVLRGTDVYHGPNMEWAPDLIAIPTSTRFHTFSPAATDEKTMNALRPAVVPRDPTFTGTHSYNGLFIASGPGFAARGRIEQQQMQDFAPTVLAALNVPIPGYTDGRVMKEIFTEGFFADGEPVRDDTATIEKTETRDESPYEGAEAEAVE